MFCIHKYSKWVDEEERNVYQRGASRPYKIYMIQSKTCKKCNKRKFRKAKIIGDV